MDPISAPFLGRVGLLLNQEERICRWLVPGFLCRAGRPGAGVSSGHGDDSGDVKRGMWREITANLLISLVSALGIEPRTC